MHHVNERLADARRLAGERWQASDNAHKRALAAKAGPDSPEFTAYQQASDAYGEAATDVHQLEEERAQLLAGRPSLSRLGPNGPEDGSFGVSGDGWSVAARGLDLPAGRLRVDMPAQNILAAVSVSPSEGLSAPALTTQFMQKAQDLRFLYPAFPRQIVDDGDLAITEFRQTGSRTVTGEIERDPMATTEKAKVGLSVTLETPSLSMFAAVVDEVPSKLFDAIPPFEAFLRNELGFQIDKAIDAHAIAQIVAATPAHGKTGTSLIEKTRNAVAAMRALGASPSVLALNATDAAALDVQKTEAAYIFATRSTGSASPLWNLQIVEVPTLTAPLLIDPPLLGVLYVANAKVLIDPFTGMSKNEVRLRTEVDGLLHIRDAAGAYLIE
jgi:hypothetical protein